MATTAEKAAYDEKTKPLRVRLERVQAHIEKEKKVVEATDPNDEITRVKLTWALINLITEEISLHLCVSRISFYTIHIKNENSLNVARKSFYIIVQLLEELVGKNINVDFEENINATQKLDLVNTNLERFAKFKIIGFLLFKLRNIYGDSSKWKWAFVELEGRFVNVFKNCINFKDLQKNLDASIDGYSERMDLLNMIIELCEMSAERYRTKYEMTSPRTIEDMSKGIDFISFQKRLALVLGNSAMAEDCTKKKDSWTKKLNEDIESEEKKSLEALRKSM